PIRQYLHQDMAHWVARFLARPGIEDLLDAYQLPSEAKKSEVLRDIWEGEVFRSFKGPDGTPFFERRGEEGRYAFSMNTDGFNPRGNMQAGKAASVTAIYLVCLNLPWTLRYHAENIYLVGVIPSPTKPSKSQINHLL
ncbi:hypothetical protein SISNIDRAFT_384049, partial [Sistotremastrum niveocremeum HHB9708]